ncbi:Eaa1 [Klebsiella pneumoniae]|nr:Eaa1 [Klebsiella pneumoniae]
MSDEIETIDKNPKSWAAWKREAERLQAIIDDMALAAIDSEPFAYIIQDKYERERGVEGHLSRSHVSKHVSQEDINEHEITCIPLYRHAQPVPVVPEEKLIPNTLSMYAVDAVAAIAEVKGWNACRAAMLAAAPQSPGSDPATVPGKWIPVSERMPDVGDIVLTAMGGSVNVGEMERSGANYRYFTSVISGRELPVTHWMPLPAAPQEAINALIPLVSRNEQEVK